MRDFLIGYMIDVAVICALLWPFFAWLQGSMATGGVTAAGIWFGTLVGIAVAAFLTRFL